MSPYNIYLFIHVITVPNAAEALSMTDRTTRSLTVMWDAPTEGGLTGYSVTVEGDGKYHTQSLANDTTTHTFVGLMSGTQYTVSVVTLAGDQKSEPLIGKYYTGMCRKEQLCITSIELSNRSRYTLLDKHYIGECWRILHDHYSEELPNYL